VTFDSLFLFPSLKLTLLVLSNLQYQCSETCLNPGPYLAGMSEDACDAQGGTWCPSPVNCGELKTCTDQLYADALSEGKKGLAAYLRLMPNITDTGSQAQCGQAREYFGFDEFFINDVQICEDVYQLRYSRDFGWISEFFGDSDIDAGPGGAAQFSEVEVVSVGGSTQSAKKADIALIDEAAEISSPRDIGTKPR
jgi:hypothetical protein